MNGGWCYWHGAEPCRHRAVVVRPSWAAPAPGTAPVVIGCAAETFHRGDQVCVDSAGQVRRFTP